MDSLYRRLFFRNRSQQDTVNDEENPDGSDDSQFHEPFESFGENGRASDAPPNEHGKETEHEPIGDENPLDESIGVDRKAIAADFSPKNWIEIGFFRAVSLGCEESPDTVVGDLVKNERELLESQLEWARSSHLEQIQNFDRECDDLLAEQQLLEVEIGPSAEKLAEMEAEVLVYQGVAREAVVQIKSAREELAQARQEIPKRIIEAQYGELNAILKGTKEANEEYCELSKSLFDQKTDLREVRIAKLNLEMEAMEQRRARVLNKIEEGDFITGRSLVQKLTIGYLMATLLGWVTAILAGSTNFDDNTILEVVAKGLLGAAKEFQGKEGGIQGKLLFLLVWILAYVAVSGALLLLVRMFSNQKGSETADNESLEDSRKGDPADYKYPDYELPLEYDSMGWAGILNRNLFLSIAPAWMMLGLFLVFGIPSDKYFDNAESSFSGFLIGFAGAWVLGLIGYYLDKKQDVESGGLGQSIRLAALLAGAGVGGFALISWLGLSSHGALYANTIRVSFTMVCMGGVLAMFLLKKVIREYVWVQEERAVNDRIRQLSKAIGSAQSPWSTMVEYRSASWLRWQLQKLQGKGGKLQEKRWNKLIEHYHQDPAKGTQRFFDVIYAEYSQFDFLIFPEIVGRIENHKRALFEARDKIFSIESDLAKLKARKSYWQELIRSQLASIKGRIREIRQRIKDEEMAWLHIERELRCGIGLMEANIRRGFSNGIWYKQKTEQDTRQWKQLMKTFPYRPMLTVKITVNRR